MPAAIPKECKTTKDVIRFLNVIMDDFKQVLKACDNCENNQFTREEIKATKLYIEALDRACDLLQKHTLNVPFKDAKCPDCNADLPKHKEVGDRVFYCQNCGQMFSYNPKDISNMLPGTRGYHYIWDKSRKN